MRHNIEIKMRHLELTKAMSCSPIHSEVKEEDFDEIKEELPGFNLIECENLIKNDFHSDDESLDLELTLSPTGALSECELPSKQNTTPRRNRRKALQPQRAIHSEVSQSGSLENSSECSQDATESTFLKLMGHDNSMLNIKTDLFMSDTENDIELPDGEDLLQDIDEENIFKGLQEETNLKMTKKLSGLQIQKRREQKKLAMRRFREKVKNNPEEREETKRKERERYYKRKAEGKVKMASDMTPRQQKAIRKKWKENTMRYRMNLKLKEDSHRVIALNIPPPSPSTDVQEDSLMPNQRAYQRHSDETTPSKNGEKLDEEMIDNVKEEWRSHWGVKCNMCEQVFPYKMEFDKHYRRNYGTAPVYTCSFCNKTAEKYSTFRSHCYRHITEGRYKCQECPKGFSLQSMLHVHVLSKHTKAKPFVCEECGKSFVTKPGLRIHLKKHKAETKEDYPCVECGKVLHTRGGLTSHMNVHRLGRRFMCDVCGKTFTQKVNMQQHVKQHTGDKPHTCDKCGKTFAEKSHLARHYSFHSNIRPYKCEVCQKMYKTERCLKVHSLVHAAARPFVCTYCSKGFLSSTKLKQHHNIHTGERPYACKYCERTFTNYPNWLKHTRRRHKVDHKTGEGLPPKVPKDEAPPTPAPIVADLPTSSDNNSDPLMVDFITLSKSDELLLQQGLISLPSSFDERFVFPPQLDLLSGTSNSSNLLSPYLQMQLPGHQTLLPQSIQSSNTQFNDILHSSLLQHSLQCD